MGKLLVAYFLYILAHEAFGLLGYSVLRRSFERWQDRRLFVSGKLLWRLKFVVMYVFLSVYLRAAIVLSLNVDSISGFAVLRSYMRLF